MQKYVRENVVRSSFMSNTMRTVNVVVFLMCRKTKSWMVLSLLFGSFHFLNFVFSYFGHFSCVIFIKFVSVLNFCLAHLALLSKKSKHNIFVTSSTKTKNEKWNEKLINHRNKNATSKYFSSHCVRGRRTHLSWVHHVSMLCYYFYSVIHNVSECTTKGQRREKDKKTKHKWQRPRRRSPWNFGWNFVTPYLDQNPNHD